MHEDGEAVDGQEDDQDGTKNDDDANAAKNDDSMMMHGEEAEVGVKEDDAVMDGGGMGHGLDDGEVGEKIFEFGAKKYYFGAEIRSGPG